MNTIADRDRWTKLWARSVQELPRPPRRSLIGDIIGLAAFLACGSLIIVWFS